VEQVEPEVKFEVFDGGLAATGLPPWDKYSFDTKKEAIQYARDWLGEWNLLPDDWDGESFDYGPSIIEVKEVP